MIVDQSKIRNFCIIAHIDHGKSTLADRIIEKTGLLTSREMQSQVLDNMDLERERGITIKSQAVRTVYKANDGNEYIFNLIDTPGHADFGGEVERVLKMVNGVVLVVDAYEGAMPQTKFVLRKALELDLEVLCLINKCDREEARPEEVVDEILELLLDLDANEHQLDCPFLFASARGGWARYNVNDTNEDMKPLFETIIKHIPAPTGDEDADPQVLISTIDYNEYVGRIGVGKSAKIFVLVDTFNAIAVGSHNTVPQNF